MLKIKQLREEQRMSRAELSRRSGVARSYITEIERGKYVNPGLNIICALSRGLRCTPNDLIPRVMYKGDESGY